MCSTQPRLILAIQSENMTLITPDYCSCFITSVIQRRRERGRETIMHVDPCISGLRAGELKSKMQSTRPLARASSQGQGARPGPRFETNTPRPLSQPLWNAGLALFPWPVNGPTWHAALIPVCLRQQISPQPPSSPPTPLYLQHAPNNIMETWSFPCGCSLSPACNALYCTQLFRAIPCLSDSDSLPDCLIA